MRQQRDALGLAKTKFDETKTKPMNTRDTQELSVSTASILCINVYSTSRCCRVSFAYKTKFYSFVFLFGVRRFRLINRICSIGVLLPAFLAFLFVFQFAAFALCSSSSLALSLSLPLSAFSVSSKMHEMEMFRFVIRSVVDNIEYLKNK